ncbi:peptidoglycan-binding protein [Candidatus Gracilibacteria bacterium]|nr:peptidoglycan-binding protein [Candidatus Gracilibacteria bacterium]
MILKKFFSSTIIFSIIFGNFFGVEKIFADSKKNFVKGEENLQNCKPQKFLVTAYYSPLPNQKFYMRGDYQADIRLNGNGTNGADGTEVYMGLLAGPKGYDFGTKIVLPGLGIGTIHDRGGAIYAHSDYIRIDIWMGKGEVGLARALNWGIQFVDGKVCGKSPELDTLDFTSISGKLPSFIEKRLIERTNHVKNGGTYAFRGSGVGGKTIVVGGKGGKKYSAPKKEIFEFVKIPQDIGFGDEGENVLKLQIILKNIGFYRENPNGVYDSATMEAVFNFQRENEVVDGLDTLGAGHFGKNTKKALENYLKNLSEKIKKSALKMEGEIIIFGEEKIEKKSNFKEKILSQKNFKPMMKEDIFSFGQSLTVKQIQQLLKEGKKVEEFEKFDKKDFTEKNIALDIS